MINIKIVISFCLLSFSFLFANVENNNLGTANSQLENKNTYTHSNQEIVKKELKKKKKYFLISKKNLTRYYKLSNYQAFWFDEAGLKNIAMDLLDKIKQDPVIKPIATKSFKLDKLLKSLKSLNNSAKQYYKNMIKIDFMFTEIYDKYMTYLSRGIINWKKFKENLHSLRDMDIIADWEKFNLRVNRAKLLLKAIENNNLNLAVKSVDFTYPNAKKLIDAIKELEILVKNGDYVKVPKIKGTLKLGDTNEVIKILRKRLTQSNDLIHNCKNYASLDDLEVNNSENINFEPVDCENIFDNDVKEAVTSFQKSHGLSEDGIVGSRTIKYLNISAEEKIEKIRLNLERMRWLPRNLGSNFLVVNIPDYNLKMYDKGKVILTMPVVVGEKKHPTPVFSNKISYVVINPYWRIPKSIAKKELIPKLIDNPNYVNEKGIKVLENWNINSYEYDSTTINWSEYNQYLTYLENIKNNKAYEPLEFSTETLMLEDLRFIQTPSDSNPLGRIKFMFPNKYSVYMHDTNAKSLFKKTKRAFSHGCIRLSHPKKLLKKISQKNENIKINEVNDILKDIEKKDFSLKKEIPVHIVYLTSWVDENGKLQFREDIYKYDKIQKNLVF